MDPLILTLLAVLIVSCLSLIGAVALVVGQPSHKMLMVLISVAAGTLLGDAFLHLLPEAAEDGLTSQIGLYVLFGFLAMYAIEALLHRGHAHGEMAHEHQHIQPFGWTNLVGDGLHNFLDGVIIAAAFSADSSLGWATTLAVALHEIPQELGDFAVLIRSGFSTKMALLVNLGSALMALLGVAVVYMLPVAPTEALALPLIAGAFIYIAAADLVPELHHHGGKDRWVLMGGLVAGIVAMLSLLQLE